MAQITFELDDNLMVQFEQFLAQQRLSKNRWLNDVVSQRINNHWVDEITSFSDLWQDFPRAETLRQDLGQDAAREVL